MNSEPVQDPSPRARGPRRTIAGQVPFDINPAASGPRRLNPRRSDDRAATARQSEEDFEGSWWLRVLICRLGDEMGRSGGQHPLEFREKFIISKAGPTAARASDGRGRRAQRRTARWINTGRGYD